MSAKLGPPRERALARGGMPAAVDSTAAGCCSLPLNGEVQDLAHARAQELGLRAAAAERLLPLLAASDFAFELLLRHPHWLEALVHRRPLPVVPFDPTQPALSLLRRQHAGALTAMAADLLDGALPQAICAQMSVLAAQGVEDALRFAETELAARHGLPASADGVTQRLVVYGMGKLGGGELNFSSDLDLVTAYAEGGETAGTRPLDYQEFYARVTRRMSQLLSEPTAEGQAWRVDLRLRPFGQAGQLALSFAAMEHYFQREGRDWERYAWIKARPVAGDLAAGHGLLDALRPFVYRRYLDYAAFEGLREMKALIDAEVRRQALEDNLKLGPGGIREIEFMVQLEQLIRGGRLPDLRTSSTLAALQALGTHQVFAPHQAQSLRENYLLLRRVENRIQMLGNAQTHELPTDALKRARLAQTLRYSDWSSLKRQLDDCRAQVATLFSAAVPGSQRTLAAPAQTPAAGDQEHQAAAHELWQQLQRDQSSSPTAPTGIGSELWQQLQQFAESHAVRGMSARSRARLDRVVPILWALAQQTRQPEATATRLIEFLTAVARRTAYLALLAEQPAAARLLVRLIGASAWVARSITRTPLVLDELIDPRLLKEPVTAAQLAAQWQLERQGRARELDQDEEAEVEALKQFQQGVMLKLAAQFLFADLPAARVLKGLSDLADRVLAVVLEQASQSMQRQHGRLPQGGGFAILGYGSLGGQELNFASDLDLVFLYDEALGEAESDGPRPLDGHRWFVRLAQRILHLLTVATRAGPLYAVDTRLRPDGGKGLLVSACDRYERYQSSDAWTWEHQALVRARFVVGDVRLRRRFARVRAAALSAEREQRQLANEVAQMRARMRAELDRSDARMFDLKQGRGGLVDLEFALQAIVLGSGVEASARRPWPTTTVGLLRRLRGTLLADTELLARAHARWTRLGLEATLAGQRRVVQLEPEDAALREQVQALLAPWLG